MHFLRDYLLTLNLINVHLHLYMGFVPEINLFVLFLQVNTCDQNVARCCEVIELNARIQSQLFKLLSLSAAEGQKFTIFVPQ